MKTFLRVFYYYYIDVNNKLKGIIIIIIIRGMGEVAPLYGVDSALVLTNPGVQ